MSKFLRKFLILLLSLTAALAVVGCDCSGDNGDDGGSSGGGDVPEVEIVTPPTPVIELVETKELVLGDSFYLNPTLKNVEGDVTWTSSDPTVLKVVDGVVETLAVGTSTVTASYEGVSDTCVITVVDGNLLPNLLTESGIEKSTTVLSVGDEYLIEPYLTFNNKRFDDVTYEYAVVGTAITVDNGKITAVQEGKANVTITATWRGKTASLSFDVQVVNAVEFIIDNDVQGDIISLGIDGTYTVGLLVNGEAVSATFTSNNDSVVSVSTTDGVKLTAVASGDATVTANYSYGGNTFSKELKVNVYDIAEHAVITIDGYNFRYTSTELLYQNELTVGVKVGDVDVTSVSLTSSNDTLVSVTDNVIKAVKYEVDGSSTISISFEYNDRTYSYLNFNVNVTHVCRIGNEWIIDKESSIIEEGSRHRECIVEGCPIKVIEVIDRIPISKLEITGTPITEYGILQSFSTEGLTAIATSSLDDSVTADVTEYLEIVHDPFTSAGNYSVVVSFGGYSKTYEVTVVDNLISVADALTQEVGATVAVRGYYIGITVLDQTARLEDGTYTQTYLLVKDTAKNDIIAIRHQFASYTLDVSNTWAINLGYTYGDEIVLSGTVCANYSGVSTVKYLEYSSNNPTDYNLTIMSKNNAVSFDFASAVQLTQDSQWSETFTTDLAPMSIIRITGDTLGVRLAGDTSSSQSRARTKETILSMNTAATSWPKYNSKYVSLSDNCLSANIGDNTWTSAIPYANAGVNANWKSAYKTNKELDIFVMYTGYNSKAFELVVLDKSWFNAATLLSSQS